MLLKANATFYRVCIKRLTHLDFKYTKKRHCRNATHILDDNNVKASFFIITKIKIIKIKYMG